MSLHCLILEFEYDRLARPSDHGLSSDRRLLAVGYASVRVVCDATGVVLGEFPLARQYAPGFHRLYGLSDPEEWGAWSDGKRSCFLLVLSAKPTSPYRVEIFSHFIFAAGRPFVQARVRVNGRYTGDVRFVAHGHAVHRISQTSNSEEVAVASNVASPADHKAVLTIVLISYNTWQLTAGSVAYVLASDLQVPYEIVVVDNGSDEDQFAALKELEVPIAILRLDERRSFGEANNVAVERASSTKILFLNNDAFVAPGCIALLSEALDDLTIGAAGPVLTYPDGRLQEAGGFINSDASVTLRDWSNFGGQLGNLRPISPIDYASAACLMMRRDDFLRLGGFDPAYEPAYNEDTDLCCRLLACGKPVVLVRDAQVMHIRSATFQTLAASDSIIGAPERSGEIFRSRWGPWLWTRDPEELPSSEAFVLDNLERLLDRFAPDRVNAIFSAQPLSGIAGAHVVAISHARVVARHQRDEQRVKGLPLRAPGARHLVRREHARHARHLVGGADRGGRPEPACPPLRSISRHARSRQRTRPIWRSARSRYLSIALARCRLRRRSTAGEISCIVPCRYTCTASLKRR